MFPTAGFTSTAIAVAASAMDLKSAILSSSRPASSALSRLWTSHQSVLLMLVAQLLSSVVSTAAKVLQTSPPAGRSGLPASEILFVMMTITAVLSHLYLRLRNIPPSPDSPPTKTILPLGAPSARPLLLLRGVAGAFGIWGYYYSLRFLPLAEATVINFLAPMLAALACAILLRTPFTKVQKIAGLLSILGVILVAKPWHIVWPHEMICKVQKDPSSAPMSFSADPGTYTGSTENCTIEGRPVSELSVPSPFEHLLAIGVALIGVAGGAASYVAISWLGKAAHPMISVWYFATCVAIMSGLRFVLLPSDLLRWPESTQEWVLLVFQGFAGFAMHVTITASLAHERSSRALNVVYAQIVFALLVDVLIWGVVPGPVSLMGGVLVLGSVIAVALWTDKTSKLEGDEESHVVGEDDGEEVVELMEGEREADEEDG